MSISLYDSRPFFEKALQYGVQHGIISPAKLEAIETEAPKGMVKVYPRRIDLENTEKLKSFEDTTVVESVADLQKAVAARLKWLKNQKISSSS